MIGLGQKELKTFRTLKDKGNSCHIPFVLEFLLFLLLKSSYGSSKKAGSDGTAIILGK
jgi:hypothetical protein